MISKATAETSHPPPPRALLDRSSEKPAALPQAPHALLRGAWVTGAEASRQQPGCRHVSQWPCTRSSGPGRALSWPQPQRALCPQFLEGIRARNSRSVSPIFLTHRNCKRNEHPLQRVRPTHYASLHDRHILPCKMSLSVRNNRRVCFSDKPVTVMQMKRSGFVWEKTREKSASSSGMNEMSLHLK